jgi:hypothetical protein
MVRDTWEFLKTGGTSYLSVREKMLLSQYVRELEIVGDQYAYFSKHFRFSVDPDDRERTTYECFCNQTYEEYRAKNTVIEYTPPETPEPPQSQVDEKLERSLAMIHSIEEIMGVSILARGGSYGGARLVIQDVKSGEELVRE